MDRVTNRVLLINQANSLKNSYHLVCGVLENLSQEIDDNDYTEARKTIELLVPMLHSMPALAEVVGAIMDLVVMKPECYGEHDE